MAIPVHFVGLLRSPVSWAKVGRELVHALGGFPNRVSATSLKGYLWEAGFPLRPEVEAALLRRRAGGWDIALDYPPNFARLRGGRRAGILVYEGDRFPDHWARAAAENLEIAFVPSDFALEAAAASGVPRDMLQVAPFGVDRRIYRPDGPAASLPTGRAFNFLAVAAPHVRKGLAELTRAFCDAFAPEDDAGLVIKCPPLEGLGQRPWEYGAVEEFIRQARAPQVSLLEGAFSEDEMAALYRAAHVYVQPSYGEAFGLAPLEALACGVPVVATAWGGVLSFLDDSNAWLVDYDLIDASGIAYDWRGEGGVRMARPRAESLASRLREAFENPARRRAKAARGLEAASRFTWRRTAKAILGGLADLEARRSFGMRAWGFL